MKKEKERPQDLIFTAEELEKAFPKRPYSHIAAYDSAEQMDKEADAA